MEEKKRERERRGERRGGDIYRPLWPLRRLPAEKILSKKILVPH